MFWQGSPRDIVFDLEQIQKKLERTERPCYVMKDAAGRIGISNTGTLVSEGRGLQVLAIANPMTADQFGDPGFRRDYNLRYNYMTGDMANGIASA
ncbi:MAG: 2-nitropropane dioxygenase, partial [Bacteroidota bacterium]